MPPRSTRSNGRPRSALDGGVPWLGIGLGAMVMACVGVGAAWWTYRDLLHQLGATSCEADRTPGTAYLETRAQLDRLARWPIVGASVREEVDAADAQCLQRYLGACRGLRDAALEAISADPEAASDMSDTSWWTHLDHEAAASHCGAWAAWSADMERRNVPVTDGCPVCQPAPQPAVR